MPMLEDSRSAGYIGISSSDPTTTDTNSSGGLCLNIGLLNNMPDAAMRHTERQFLGLLRKGAGSEIRFQMQLFAMHEIERSDQAFSDMRGRYKDIEEAYGMPLDALIVTGTEPRAARLESERYWGRLQDLIAWAEENTISTVWSCLASHATLLYLDGIERRPLKSKRFGVFECETEQGHSLMRGLSKRIHMPHSRHNDVAEEDLRSAGYHVLTRSRHAGADMFIKARKNSLFVFFQGHPEYDRSSLLREYRRDILRFLSGERHVYPTAPENYLSAELEKAFGDFEIQAKLERRRVYAFDIPDLQDDACISHEWSNTAAQIYENWLAYVAATKLMRVPVPAVRLCS